MLAYVQGSNLSSHSSVYIHKTDTEKLRKQYLIRFVFPYMLELTTYAHLRFKD